MDPLIPFTIPIKGLNDGIHQFDFQIDRRFFDHFENAPIGESSIQLDLELEKRQGLYVFDFNFEGRVQTSCDRCLAAIGLPIAGEHRLLVKVSEALAEGIHETEEDPDVVFISPEAQQFDISPYAYEYICLSLPMITVYDCEEDDPLPCNQDMLARIAAAEQLEAEEAAQDNPIWEELKKLNNHNN